MARTVAGNERSVAGGTIGEVLFAAARAWGAAPALAGCEIEASFAELEVQVRAAARAVVAAGIAPGDRVAVWAPNSGRWIVAALAAQAVGAVLVPVNTRFKGGEARHVLRRSRARLLFTVTGFLGTDYVAALRAPDPGATDAALRATDPALHATDPGATDAAPAGDARGRRRSGSSRDAGTGAPPVPALPELERIVVLEGALPPGCLAWSAFLAAGASVPPDEVGRRAALVRPGDPCDVLFTSGTTGLPKGVLTTHHQALRAQRSWIALVGLRAGDRYLIVNPFFHAFGYRAGWLSCLLAGATILPEAVFDPARVLERVAREGVTVLPGPPTLYQSLLAAPERADRDLSSLRLAVTGAASVPVELVRRMRSELGFRVVVTGYGLTECSGVATMCRGEDDPETIARTAGRAIADVEVRVVDDAGHELPPGSAGEVVVRGYNVMQGYLEDEESTRRVIDADGWLHTGDVGIMDERGYLRITDRKKDIYIVGGFNVSPAEVEGILLGHPGVAQVAVVGAPDHRLGEVGVAFVVPAPGTALSAGELIAWARQAMANFKVPRHVEVVATLPLTASGKVTKVALAERARRLVARATLSATPGP